MILLFQGDEMNIKQKKRTRIISSTVLFILMTIFTACSKTDQHNNQVDKEIYTEFEQHYQGDILHLNGFEDQNYYDMGLWKDSTALHDSTIYMNANEPFGCFFSISNKLGTNYNFTILVFDNYEQIEFTVDNDSMTKCTVNINNGSSINVPITIPSMQEGKHDLVFVVFVDTYRDLTENERIYAGSKDGALRCNVIVNDNSNFLNKFIESNYEKLPARTDGVRLNKIDEEKYIIEAGNLVDSTEYCAIILLDNYVQVNITETQSFCYITLKPDEEITIPITDYVNNDGKDHEVSTIFIRDAGLSGENFQGIVSLSNRILFDF
jgi:hypothetical protein